jgi:hypothetical protein
MPSGPPENLSECGATRAGALPRLLTLIPARIAPMPDKLRIHAGIEPASLRPTSRPPLTCLRGRRGAIKFDGPRGSSSFKGHLTFQLGHLSFQFFDPLRPFVGWTAVHCHHFAVRPLKSRLIAVEESQ